jgi:hypothetical protein
VSENDLLVRSLKSRFHHVIDDVWGPLDPRVHPGLSIEFRAAHAAVSAAVFAEMAEKERGKALISRFAEDPEEICPRKPKPHIGGGGGVGPTPEPPEPIDPELVGASLVALSGLIVNEGLAKATLETGTGLMR